jgi:hypothetical protein
VPVLVCTVRRAVSRNPPNPVTRTRPVDWLSLVVTRLTILHDNDQEDEEEELEEESESDDSGSDDIEEQEEGSLSHLR